MPQGGHQTRLMKTLAEDDTQNGGDKTLLVWQRCKLSENDAWSCLSQSPILVSNILEQSATFLQDYQDFHYDQIV
jgi:hypothetical protein